MRVDLAAQEIPETRSYDRDKFTPRMALACDLLVLGKSNAEIAAELDLAESTVSIWLGDPRSHAYIREVRRRVADSMPSIFERLEVLAHEAVSTATEVMRNATRDETRLKASFGLLDRAGYSPVTKVLSGKMPEIPAEVADRMEETLSESREIAARFRFTDSDIPPRPPESDEALDG